MLTQGHEYTDMVKLIDFAYDVPTTLQEGKDLVGGLQYECVAFLHFRACLFTHSPIRLRPSPHSPTSPPQNTHAGSRLHRHGQAD
jgi:hypothetical protein